MYAPGAKYAIDNDAIAPLKRINLSYTLGAPRITLAIKLKQKHKNFKAFSRY